MNRSDHHHRLRRHVARVALAGLLLLPAAAAADDVLFATEGDYPPWNEVAADGRVVGFDADLVAAICAETGKDCQMTTASFPAMMDRLAAGEFDAIISGIAITPGRESVIQFSRPYMSLSVSFAAAAGSPLASAAPGSTEALLDLLADTHIGAQTGTVNAALVESLLPGAKLTLFDDQQRLDRAVAEGEVDAGVAATLAWTKPGAADRTIVTVGQPFASADYPVLGEGLAIGIAHGDDILKTALDDAICKLTEAGTVSELSAKWFGTDLSVPCDSAE